MSKMDKYNFENLSRIRSSVKRMEDAKNQPHVKQIISMIWQSNEIHILFADTGVGKSILATVISNAISKGEKFLFLENEHEAMPVLFYDFELSDRQFKKRYSNDEGEGYMFNNNFFIDEIDFASLIDIDTKASFNDILFKKIEFDINDTKAKVLVIDNLTFLSTQTTQDTQIALEVMRKLNELKKKYDLSILVLAHTPKKYLNTPITIMDLAGSKHLSNFADSVSAIGKSTQGSSIRYWKQIKPSRSGELIFDIDNVITCEIAKENNFLTFKFISLGSEYDHLHEETGNKSIPLKLDEVVELLKKGHSYDHIAGKMGISKGTITKWKRKYPEKFVSVSSVSNEGDFGNMETETSLEKL